MLLFEWINVKVGISNRIKIWKLEFSLRYVRSNSIRLIEQNVQWIEKDVDGNLITCLTAKHKNLPNE